MTAADITNFGAGIVALFIIFWTFMQLIKSLKPFGEKIFEVVQNNTAALNSNRETNRDIARALELLETSIRCQTENYEKKLTEHDNRAADIQKDVKEIKHLLEREE